MRHEPNLRIEKFRRRHPVYGLTPFGSLHGYFEAGPLRIISSGTGASWEHVSVSLPNRCPTWDEMCKVKAFFWSDDETVVEFHPRADRYKNLHPFCLHLWKRSGGEFDLPPGECV